MGEYPATAMITLTMRAILDEVTQKAGQISCGAVFVEERIQSVSAGYEEMVELSGGLLGDPAATDECDAEKTMARAAVVKSARFLAVKATKVSAAAAKTGAERFKHRNQDGHPN
jgi:hypothetical protein